MLTDTIKAIVRNGGSSRCSAVGKIEGRCFEVRGFEPVSGTLLFADMKISNQSHTACCSSELLATLSCFMFLCVFGA